MLDWLNYPEVPSDALRWMDNAWIKPEQTLGIAPLIRGTPPQASKRADFSKRKVVLGLELCGLKAQLDSSAAQLWR
jgi:hypothetical protein